MQTHTAVTTHDSTGRLHHLPPTTPTPTYMNINACKQSLKPPTLADSKMLLQSKQFRCGRLLVLVSFMVLAPGRAVTVDSRIRSRENAGWTTESFPNPESDPESCQSSYSRICDPDGQLSAKDANNISERIESFEVNTPLACKDAYFPLQLGVAIVKKMDLSNYYVMGDEAKDEAAKELGMGIHDDWGVGVDTPCGGTGIVLFLSIEDRKVFISTGAAAKKVLDKDRLGQVIKQMGAYLRQSEYGNAVVRAIDDMETFVLQGPPSPVPFLIFSACFVSIIMYMSIRESREKRKYVEARSRLSKLDKDRALALQGKYECTSCAICLEDFPQVTKGEERMPLAYNDPANSNAAASAIPDLPTVGSDGWPLKLLRCGHAFDATCWDKWVGSGHGDPGRCPICKQSVGGSPPPVSPISQQGSASYSRGGGEIFGQESSVNAFELERAFRLNQMRMMYPRYVRRADVERWTTEGYTAPLASDPSFTGNNPQRYSSSGGDRHAGGSSFGGGSSSGGCGGSW